MVYFYQFEIQQPNNIKAEIVPNVQKWWHKIFFYHYRWLKITQAGTSGAG